MIKCHVHIFKDYKRGIIKDDVAKVSRAFLYDNYTIILAEIIFKDHSRLSRDIKLPDAGGELAAFSNVLGEVLGIV